MAYKRTYAFIRGTWDGAPGSSNFTQDVDTFTTSEEFISDYGQDVDIKDLTEEYMASGDVTNKVRELSADGKVKITTTEYVDEAAHDAYAGDSRWAAEFSLTKAYNVELAPIPEDVGTFNEGERVYYHSVAHLF